MRILPLLAAAALACPAAAPAAEVFAGLHAHGVKTPLSLNSDREGGADLSAGIRGGRIGGTPLQPYAFASVNLNGGTNFLAAGVSARFGNRIYVRPGVGLAIHDGSASKVDLPDRLADPLILLGAGAAITTCPWGRDLGWLAALLAVLTAYLRLLGGACGLPQSFIGPMAKQQRMAVMTAACLMAAAVHHRGWDGWLLAVALGIVILGALWTCVRRTRGIVAGLAARASAA